MKEEYIKPEIECIEFECEAMIAGSAVPGAGDPLNPSAKSARDRRHFWEE